MVKTKVYYVEGVYKEDPQYIKPFYVVAKNKLNALNIVKKRFGKKMGLTFIKNRVSFLAKDKSQLVPSELKLFVKGVAIFDDERR